MILRLGGAAVLVVCAFLFIPENTKPSSDGDNAAIAAELERALTKRLLEVWYPRALDVEHGGFLSTFDYKWEAQELQNKMIVTQARHVWVSSKAHQLYPGNDAYRTCAAHGFRFLRDHMWDEEFGGFHTLVDRKGAATVEDMEEKTAYGNAFAIYGLAAYYESFGDEEALDLARETFWWLEKHSRDPVHKGYFQSLHRNGRPMQRGSSDGAVGFKDQNSSIHLLEAFTELYQVWPDSLLRERLAEMLYLIRDTIVTEKGYMTLFFEPDWTPVSFRDSAAAVIAKHHELDHVSFGHDVETAYLILEASHVLGLEDSVSLAKAKKMVDHALDNGWDEDAGGFYDAGYYFKDTPGITITKETKNWWAQAEGLNSLQMMAELFPDDKRRYGAKFEQLWDYIKNNLIDQKYGGWYAGGLDKQPEQKTALKSHIWKAPYHTFRSLANCLRRLNPDNQPPSAPPDLQSEPAGDSLTLRWEPSSDNRRVKGYYVYRHDKRIGFTPLNSYRIPLPAPRENARRYVKAVDLDGNESAASQAGGY